ncbi:MAG: class I SAM-dependent methyltransferase [Acetobacterium sp.]|nr:class I SAM-dependent methyltransferase [Acetobacterium sp.]
MSSKAENFDRMVQEVFAPVFPVIARDFLKKSGITAGTCLDIGCGTGYMGLAMAEASDLEVTMLDCDPEMLGIAQLNCRQRQLDNQVKLLEADVHEIPFEDESVQLVVSRGSVFFWQDQAKAFREIYRVLAPGGTAFVGGGFGTPELKAQIDAEMLKRNPNWLDDLQQRIGPQAPIAFHEILTKSDIPRFEIDYTQIGIWVIIQK